MHEFSIVQSLLQTAEAEARSRGATAVHRLEVRIGELAGVEIELLRSAYELVRGRTLCAGAELTITPSAVRWACSGCGRTVERGGVLQCPDCGKPARLVQGDEILLERMELEVA